MTSIEEIIEEEEDVFQASHKLYKDFLKHCDSTNNLLDKRKAYVLSKLRANEKMETTEEEKQSKVTFSNIPPDDQPLDDKSDLILEELVQSSINNDLLESCEKAW